jgi:hypothetical protein
MQKRGLSQEGLKLIACATMLLDHFAIVIVMDWFYKATGASKAALLEIYETLRIIGRLAFPIYCFLLVEGASHTRNPKRYALRLLIAALLSELPFDLAIFGGFTWQHQSVMVTLLLGFLMLEVMEKCPHRILRLLLVIPFGWLAEWMHTDYGAMGIYAVALFFLTRQLPRREIWQFVGLWFIFSPNHLMMLNWLGGFSLTVQELAAFAVLPIMLYDGRKMTKNKVVQWAFYLFYPVHLLALYLIVRL